MNFHELYAKFCEYLTIIQVNYKIKKNQRFSIINVVLCETWCFSNFVVYVQDV